MIRRRKRRKHSKFLKRILFVFVILSIVGVGYSYLNLQLKITGSASGAMSEQNYTIASGSNPNLKISIEKTNSWQEGGLYKYQYSFHVSNIGTTNINSFKITTIFLNNIDSVSLLNYDYTYSAKTLAITNNIYILEPQQSITIDFVLASKYSGQIVQSIKLDVIVNTGEVTLDQFNVNFSIVGSSGQYTYQYDITLINKTGSKINSWQLVIPLPTNTTYVSGSSAIFSVSGNILTIKNENYNGRLNNNGSTTIGLQLSTDILNYIPSTIRVTVK